MQTPNYYLIEGVLGRWQFWAEAPAECTCWVTPTARSEQALAALRQRHPEIEVQGAFALVPTSLLRPEILAEQPSLF